MLLLLVMGSDAHHKNRGKGANQAGILALLLPSLVNIHTTIHLLTSELMLQLGSCQVWHYIIVNSMAPVAVGLVLTEGGIEEGVVNLVEAEEGEAEPHHVTNMQMLDLVVK